MPAKHTVQSDSSAGSGPAGLPGYGSLDASAYQRDQYGTGGSKRAGHKGHKGRQERPASDAGAQSGYRQPSVDEIYPEIARVRKRNRRVKRVLLVVGAVVLAVVFAGGAYAFWFFHSLDSELAPDEATMSKLGEVLVPTVSGEPFYVLLIGSDSREGSWSPIESERNDEHSDVMILARIDAKNSKITLLSIPRDTPYTKEDGTVAKLNGVYNTDGAAGVVKQVAKLTGAEIAHYAEVHVSGLEAVVDLLGGVTVDVPIKLSYVTTDNVDVTVEPGTQTLNGQQAQIFARSRHDYETDQEANRQDAVRQLLVAIIQKTLKRPVTEIPGIVLEEAKYVDTDMKSGELVGLATSFGSNGGKMTVYTGTGPSDGDVNPAADGQWMCFENPEGWKAVMEVVDAGEDPHGMDFSETSIPWPPAEQ